VTISLTGSRLEVTAPDNEHAMVQDDR
jgi:hypothetical protein